MAAMAAAPIIPAPTLKPLPAFFVAVEGAEVEATEDADEAVVLAGTALDPVVVDVTGTFADVATVTTDEATEVAEETADAAVDATEAGLVEVPLARAAEQISFATLLVAVA
jgi:catabolite regulation protein CreA